MTTTPEDLLWPGAAAKRVGVHPHTLRRWAAAGLIPSQLLPSGRRRYRRSDLDALFATNTEPT